MSNTITLEQAEQLTAQLPPREQLWLMARISERLSKLELTVSETTSDENLLKPKIKSKEALQRMVELSEDMGLYDE